MPIPLRWRLRALSPGAGRGDPPARRSGPTGGHGLPPDGRYVTDYDAFSCAIGEAVDGPGGWLGGDQFWLREMAVGGGGFRLV